MPNLAITPNPVNRLSKRERELHAVEFHCDLTKPPGQSMDDWWVSKQAPATTASQPTALKSGNGLDQSPEAKATVVAAEETKRAEADAATTHDKEMARRYLTALAPGAIKYTFQLFSDDKTLSAGEAKKFAKIIHGTLDEVWPKVLALNTPQQRVGVFVAINETDFKGRSVANIVRGRALAADADSKEQATKCLAQLTACGAGPSMIVDSGRGYHFYFCTDVPRDQFTSLQQQLAAKLGTDPKVHDLPRVLRLPGTLHLKDAANPKLVRLLNAPGVNVPRWQLSELVSKLGLSLIAAEAKQKPASYVFCHLSKQPQSPDLLTPEYQREIGEVELLSITPIIKSCPFMGEGLKTGGRDHDQGLWMLNALATTFMENGRAVFHALSRGHRDYDGEKADAMFDRKEAEQHDKKLGWPSCKTFEQYGSKQCASCPLKGTIRSPLNITLPIAAVPATDVASQAPTATTSNGFLVAPTPTHKYPALRTAAEVDATKHPEPRYTIEGLIREGWPQTLDGDGQVGKSIISGQACVSIAAGVEFMGRTVIQSPAIFVTHEDEEGEIKYNMKAYCKYIGVDFASLPIQFACWPGEDICLAEISDAGGIKPGPFLRTFEEWLAANPRVFVVLDCLSDVMQGNLFLRGPPNAFYKTLLQGLCAKYGCTLLVLAHPSKTAMADGSDYEGGTANKTALRNKLLLKLDDPKNIDGPRWLSTLKRNSRRSGGLSKPIRLVFSMQHETFVAPTDPEIHQEKEDAFEAVVRAVQRRILNKERVDKAANSLDVTPGDIAREVGLGLTKKDVLSHMKWAETTGKYLRYVGADSNKRPRVKGHYEILQRIRGLDDKATTQEAAERACTHNPSTGGSI